MRVIPTPAPKRPDWNTVDDALKWAVDNKYVLSMEEAREVWRYVVNAIAYWHGLGVNQLTVFYDLFFVVMEGSKHGHSTQ